MLEFTDSVKILHTGDRQQEITRVTKRIYIILNKLCNNKITINQIISPEYRHDITEAIQILNSHSYQHNYIHQGNVVDCGKSSMPRYKLIDFGSMRETPKNPEEKDYDKISIQLIIEELTTHVKALAAIKAKKDAEKAAKDDAEKAAKEAAAEAARKFEIIQKSYPELRKKYRFMVTNYISEYLHSVCTKAVVSSSYKSPEKGLNYHVPNGYPSATFEFE